VVPSRARLEIEFLHFVIAFKWHRATVGDGGREGVRYPRYTPAIRLRTIRPSAYGPFRRSGTGPAYPAWRFRHPQRPRPLFSASGGTGPVPWP